MEGMSKRERDGTIGIDCSVDEADSWPCSCVLCQWQRPFLRWWWWWCADFMPHATLNLTRSRMGSQWSSRSTGVMWARRRVPLIVKWRSAQTVTLRSRVRVRQTVEQRITRRLFGFNKWESVSAMLLGRGRLNTNHLIMLHRVKFHRHLSHSCGIFYVM